jgi:ribose transport system substrate-binding protein
MPRSPEFAKNLKGVQDRLGGHRHGRSSAQSRTSSTRASTPSSSTNTPKGWDRVVRLANQKGTVLIAFDNQVEGDTKAGVAQDQTIMGVQGGQWLVDHIGKMGKLLEFRGVPGFSADQERHDGFRSVVEGDGMDFEIVEVIGNWAPGDSQKATADAIAAHGQFDGIFTQGGSNGTVQALIDAKHPFVPMAGEGENLFRIQMAQYADQGLKGFSYGQSPAQVAIAEGGDRRRGQADPRH